jgi:LPS export ABC transporter protein LptC
LLKVLLKKRLHKILFLFLPLTLLITSSVVISFGFKKKTIKTHHLNKKKLTEKIKEFIDQNQEKNTFCAMPEIIIREFKMKHACDNKKESWAISSKIGKIYKISNKIDCSNVLCQLRIKNQEIAQLHSDKSIVNRNNKNIFLCGPVTGNFRELKINGQDINYNFSDQTISSEKPLHYAYPNFHLKAKQSCLYLNKNKIEMSGGIRTEILNNTTGNHSYN